MSQAFLDVAPDEPHVTDYDRAHAAVYLRLLDAEAAGADWGHVAARLFCVDPDAEPDRARRLFDTHLARARWISSRGYRDLIGSGPQAG